MSAATLALTLLDGRSRERIEDVSHVVAADASGQFGLLPGHEPLVTVLEPGLFRYQRGGQQEWSYAACAGGLLAVSRAAQGGTEVCLVSRRFLRGDTPEALQSRLDELLERETQLRLSTRESREQLDLAFYRRMQQLAQARP